MGLINRQFYNHFTSNLSLIRLYIFEIRMVKIKHLTEAILISFARCLATEWSGNWNDNVNLKELYLAQTLLANHNSASRRNLQLAQTLLINF